MHGLEGVQERLFFALKFNSTNTTSPTSLDQCPPIVHLMQKSRYNAFFPIVFICRSKSFNYFIQEIPLQRGDWMVVATDGVWDNLYERQIVDILLNSSSPTEVAREIGEQAVECSMDE